VIRRAFVVACTFLVMAGCRDRPAPPAEQPAPPPSVAAVPAPEPPPPPTRGPSLLIEPRWIAFDAVGDTARLRLPPGASCLSQNVDAAVVEGSDLVRSTGVGDAVIRCRLGGAVGTARVNVLQKLTRVAVTADGGLVIRKSGDSLALSLARVDRLNTPIPTLRPTWVSLTPDQARVDPATGVVVALVDSGAALLVGVAGTLADTVTIGIGERAFADVQSLGARQTSRPRTDRSLRTAAVRGRSTAGGPGAPVESRTSMNVVRARPITRLDEILQDSTQIVGVRRPRTVTVSAIVSTDAHRVVANTTLEKTSGLMYGLSADIITRGFLSFHGQFTTGTLAVDTNAQTTRRTSDAFLDIGVLALPWLTFRGGVGARAYTFRFGALETEERWWFVRAGADARVGLGGGPLTGIIGLTLLPLSNRSSSSGGQANPTIGLTSITGLDYRSGRFSAGLRYFLDRYNFERGSAIEAEQFSGLLLKLGYTFGW